MPPLPSTLPPLPLPTTPLNTSPPLPRTSPTPTRTEEEIAYTQSNFLPTEVTSTNKLPSSTINTFTDLQTHNTFGKETLSLCHAKGPVWSRNNITRCTFVIKLAITASAICNQSPTTKGLELVINTIITSINLKFTVDCIAILSFKMAITTRKHGNVYFSYTFLSSRSTNPTTTPTLTPTIAHRQLEILQGCLHTHLDGPHYFDKIPNLSPLASHLQVSIPLINNMDETFRFIIDGISVGLLLGTNGPENTLTLCYLSYRIFAAIKTIYPTLLPYHPFQSPKSDNASTLANSSPSIKLDTTSLLSPTHYHLHNPHEQPHLAPHTHSLAL
jgi:hypothetical protein